LVIIDAAPKKRFLLLKSQNNRQEMQMSIKNRVMLATAEG